MARIRRRDVAPPGPAGEEFPDALREAVSRAPTGPGCYIWKDESGTVLYVGKAQALKTRVKSYLRPEHVRTHHLMSQARALEWITTDTAAEALVLEANLIKKHKPRYNVQLKDDKRYPYICVSMSEPYPRIFITRQIRDDGNRYFGPFADVRSARDTLSLIHKIFPIRKTALKLPLKKPQRPCMNYFIKRCLAPCRGDIPTDEYARIVDEILLFLQGRREILETRVAERMARYSKEQQYEKAAVYRDVLVSVRRTAEKQNVMNPAGGDEDIIGCAVSGDTAQIVVLEIRDGRLLGRKSFPLVGTQDAPEEEILSAFLRDYCLLAESIPDRILIPRVPPDRRDLAAIMSERTERTIRILHPQAPDKRALLKMAARNAELLLKERLLAVRMRDRRDALEQLKEMLSLTELPGVIECYDISHFQGAEPVASGIMFVDGHPHKPGYRTYAMRSIEGINDPAMIQEVIARRLQRLLNEDSALPDLFVVDGGPAQLAAACAAAQALGQPGQPFVALAKQREELYVPGNPAPLIFDPQSPGMRVLRHARDEAHRFGVAFHRKRRNRQTLRHLVEALPEIGPARKKALLIHLGGTRLEEATRADLLRVPGIGPLLSEKIVAFFSAPATGAKAGEGWKGARAT